MFAVDGPKQALIRGAANGSSEPVLPDFSFLANGCCRDFARNVQQPLGFGTEFVAA
jgi:hypothetical protein